MSKTLLCAVLTITLALCFYTIGVFWERKSGRLKKPHIVIFWLGFLFDTTGTTLMSAMGKGASLFSLHGITGALAIVLMLFHAVWATLVYRKQDEKRLVSFHKFSIIVWLIWLIPYILGIFLGMSH